MVAIVGKGGGECVATRQRRPWFMVGMVSRVLNVLVLGVGVVGGCCVGFVCGGGWVAFWREKSTPELTRGCKWRAECSAP